MQNRITSSSVALDEKNPTDFRINVYISCEQRSEVEIRREIVVATNKIYTAREMVSFLSWTWTALNKCTKRVTNSCAPSDNIKNMEWK